MAKNKPIVDSGLMYPILLIIFLVILLVFSLNTRTEDTQMPITYKNDPVINSETSVTISYSQAEAFMKVRCNNIEMSFVDGKTVSLDDGKLYVFLIKSIQYSNKYCVSTMNTFVFDVLSVKCGGYEKVEQFNNMLTGLH